MATFLNLELPGGWTSLKSTLQANNTRIGRPGRWTIVQNDDYRIWQARVSYLRSDFEENTDLSFDELYRFFLASGAAYCFKVNVIDDNTATARGGSGVVSLVNGVYRLMKRYAFGGQNYDHPITRPNGTIVLGGGASGGTVAPATGIVTGIASTGSWTGKFFRPMVFADNALSYTLNPDGTIEAFDVALEEQLEI